MQGELEHRTSKARYKRTDKKDFVRQLAKIERREARLRRLRAKLSDGGQPQDEETVAADPLKHHHIGRSQNNYHHIGTFLHNNAADPAVKVGVVRVIDSCKPDKTYSSISCRSWSYIYFLGSYRYCETNIRTIPAFREMRKMSTLTLSFSNTIAYINTNSFVLTTLPMMFDVLKTL